LITQEEENYAQRSRTGEKKKKNQQHSRDSKVEGKKQQKSMAGASKKIRTWILKKKTQK
jgi:hypothetical protein